MTHTRASLLSFVRGVTLTALVATSACQVHVTGGARHASAPTKIESDRDDDGDSEATKPAVTAKRKRSRSDSGADPALVKLFEQLTYADFPYDRHWGDPFELLERKRIDLATMPTTGTPSPEWLPGWPGGLRGGKLADAFVQGVVNKTWQARCYDDYSDYRTQWRAIEDKIGSRLEAARAKKNPYSRMQELTAAWSELQAQVKTLRLVPVKNPERWSGLGYEIVRDIIVLNHGLERAPAIEEWYRTVKDYVGAGYAAPSDDQLRRDLFCYEATDHGTHRTHEPYRTQSYKELGEVVRAVDWDKPEAHTKIAQALAEAKKAREALALPDTGLRSSAFDLAHGTYKAGQVVRADAVVDSLQRQASGATLTVKITKDETTWGNCKSTGKIEGYDEEGHPKYGSVCDALKETTEATITVSLADLPASITLEKGDEVRLYGTVASWKETPQAFSGRTSIIRKTLRLSDGYLGRVKRGKAIVQSFDGTVMR
ncbi:MAG: hypothetical protein ACHREM_18620 [Polyangiales bacterium]